MKFEMKLFNKAKHAVEVLVSVVQGDKTPLVISKEQLADWNALIDVAQNAIELEINQQRVQYVCPESRSGLTLLPLVGMEKYAMLTGE